MGTNKFFLVFVLMIPTCCLIFDEKQSFSILFPLTRLVGNIKHKNKEKFLFKYSVKLPALVLRFDLLIWRRLNNFVFQLDSMLKGFVFQFNNCLVIKRSKNNLILVQLAQCKFSFDQCSNLFICKTNQEQNRPYIDLQTVNANHAKKKARDHHIQASCNALESLHVTLKGLKEWLPGHNFPCSCKDYQEGFCA